MPHFPSLPDAALVADVYPMSPKLFKPWCEVEEAIMVCCCYAFMNRLADGHGLPSDPAMFKERGRRHMENGYVAQYAEETASGDD